MQIYGLSSTHWFQVKDANIEKFRAIASEPKDQNAFKIEKYDGLTGILENFQNKIFKMEGDVCSYIYTAYAHTYIFTMIVFYTFRHPNRSGRRPVK